MQEATRALTPDGSEAADGTTGTRPVRDRSCHLGRTGWVARPGSGDRSPAFYVPALGSGWAMPAGVADEPEGAFDDVAVDDDCLPASGSAR